MDTAGQGGVERITEDAVVVGGTAYEVDCVIFATGFEVGIPAAVSGLLPVHGRGGVTVAESWRAGGPKSLHGFYSHGFPSLFQLGPLQNASAVNFVHILDEQATHVAAVLAEARKRRARYVRADRRGGERLGRHDPGEGREPVQVPGRRHPRRAARTSGVRAWTRW